MAAPKGSPKGRSLDLAQTVASRRGPGPAGDWDDGRKCSGWEQGQIRQNGPEYLLVFHDSSPEGVMLKAFPVIDPGAPVSDILSQSPSTSAPLSNPD